MVTCGHQFHMGGEWDWLISSSAVCPVNNNSSATKILKNLIQAHCKARQEENESSFSENDRDNLDLSFYAEHRAPEEVESGKLIVETEEIPLNRVSRKMMERTGSFLYDSDGFDDEQHLEGCPIKWYYRKRTKDGWGPCVALKRNNEGTRIDQGTKKFRDRIPLEVKIGKISLNKRESTNEFRPKKNDMIQEAEKYKKFEIDPKVMEIQKKRLEAKLNWRPFQEDDQDDSELSLRGSLDGYLRPRSIIGGKLPVSILLFPYQQQNCFCVKTSHKEVPEIKVKRVSSHSARHAKSSNNSEIENSSKNPRPKTTQSLRWGSKTQRKGKKLQIPKQTNVFFDSPKRRCAPGSAGPPEVKKKNEKKAKTKKSLGERKNSQSLTSLYYELEDKSNSGKAIDDEYLEKMIRELSMEDNLRGIRSILNPIKKKIIKEEKEFHRIWTNDDHFKVICKKVKFYKRKSKGSPISEAKSADKSPGMRNF